jgi:hypothetical protein
VINLNTAKSEGELMKIFKNFLVLFNLFFGYCQANIIEINPGNIDMVLVSGSVDTGFSKKGHDTTYNHYAVSLVYLYIDNMDKSYTFRKETERGRFKYMDEAESAGKQEAISLQIYKDLNTIKKGEIKAMVDDNRIVCLQKYGFLFVDDNNIIQDLEINEEIVSCDVDQGIDLVQLSEKRYQEAKNSINSIREKRKLLSKERNDLSRRRRAVKSKFLDAISEKN